MLIEVVNNCYNREKLCNVVRGKQVLGQALQELDPDYPIGKEHFKMMRVQTTYGITVRKKVTVAIEVTKGISWQQLEKLPQFLYFLDHSSAI